MNDLFEKYGDEPTIMEAIEDIKETEKKIEHKKQTDANKLWKTLGASNHTGNQRQAEDFYETDPEAIDRLVNSKPEYAPDKNSLCWECAVGRGSLADRLEQFGYEVYGSDLIDRANGKYDTLDFLQSTRPATNGKPLTIITNPPFQVAESFVTHACSLIKPGERVYMLLKTLWLEGQKRQKLIYKNPEIQLKYLLQFSKRVSCFKDGEQTGHSGAQAYAWYVFEKPEKPLPVIDWI